MGAPLYFKCNVRLLLTVGCRSLLSKRGVAGVIFGWQTRRDERLQIIDWLEHGGRLRRAGVSGLMQMRSEEARLAGGSVHLFDVT